MNDLPMSPRRARDYSRLSFRVLTMLVSIIVVLGLLLFYLVARDADAVHALRQSSGRSECRTHVTNDAEDLYRHQVATLFIDVSDLIKQANGHDPAGVEASLHAMHDLAAQMKAEPLVQSQIVEECPAPLVAGTTVGGHA